VGEGGGEMVNFNCQIYSRWMSTITVACKWT